MKRLAIYGCGGHGLCVADAAYSSGWQEIIFFDEDWSSQRHIKNNNPPIGNFKDLIRCRNNYDEAFVAIGDNKQRTEKTKQIKDIGVKIAIIKHPRAIISESSYIEMGALICAGVILQSNVKIGMSAIINTGAIVDHDTCVDEGAHICPGVNIAGKVSIGKKTFIGIGATVINNIVIGDNVIIGAGSVVIRDVGDNSKLSGIPAVEM